MEETIERNQLGRIRYQIKDENLWLDENSEWKFIKWLEEYNRVFVWDQEFLIEFFDTLKQQNSFIKRMIKYGVLISDVKTGIYPTISNIRLHTLNEIKTLHIHSGHNLEHWIRDNWEHYSTETMEVVTVKGIFDTPDHHRMFIAHDNILHSFTIKADTDKTVWEALYKIEKELNLS